MGDTSLSTEVKMRRIAWCCVIAVALGWAMPQPVQAQDRDGWGAFLDWLNKLSGPRMVGPAVSGFVSASEDVDVRLTLARRWATDADETISAPPSSSVTDPTLTMWAIRPAVEYRLHDYLSVGGGFEIQRFGGDVEAFTHWSVPVYAHARMPLLDGVRLAVSLGGQYFPAFDLADFLPMTVDVKTDGGEMVVPWFSAGLEIVRD